MNKQFEILSWDSELFQFKVCQINDLPQNDKEFASFMHEIFKEEITLCYYRSIIKLALPTAISGFFDINLIDRKTTYSKPLAEKVLPNSNIQPYKKSYPEEKLFDLAIQSGIYSRFNVDEKISTSTFEELYKLWIINSVNKKIAKEVLVYYKQDELAGFVTLGEKNNRADIGIIAVDEKFRGKGIARALMSEAENWFIDNGYHNIQVVTQELNIPACKLYERCGYEKESQEYFYHFWKK